MQTEGSNPPFFCVPQAGSTVYSLSNLARHLAPKQPFYGLQPLGIDGENSPHTRIEDMAAHYIEEIKSVQPQGPYLLGGRCFGSTVAFEMAQQLCTQGEEVALLAILGDNFIPAWARKGIKDSKSAFSIAHSFQRTIYYLRHSSLGDVFRTAVSEINIRVNPYLKGTKRILKAQLLALTHTSKVQSVSSRLSYWLVPTTYASHTRGVSLFLHPGRPHALNIRSRHWPV
jgi:thioesterase domain-containing protein